ncbi:MAG: hypothetical protein COA33_003915 [Fluviicola sp.]|nr:hypothetical protein [Fluviicola sp.]
MSNKTNKQINRKARIVADVLVYTNLLVVLALYLLFQFMDKVPQVVESNVEIILLSSYSLFLLSAGITLLYNTVTQDKKMDLYIRYFAYFMINFLVAFFHYALLHMFDEGIFG